MVACTLTIPGAPRTKKNHSRIFRAGGRPRIMPSKAHEDWYGAALTHVIRWRVLTGQESITVPVNVTAIFWRDRNTGDAVGYYQALGDLLQAAGVLADDKLIVSWDGSRLYKSDQPRIEVEITAATT